MHLKESEPSKTPKIPMEGSEGQAVRGECSALQE